MNRHLLVKPKILKGRLKREVLRQTSLRLDLEPTRYDAVFFGEKEISAFRSHFGFLALVLLPGWQGAQAEVQMPNPSGGSVLA